MSTFEKIQQLNPSLKIQSVDDPTFNRYAQVIDGYDNYSVATVMDRIKLPTDFYYKISSPDLESDAEIQKVGANVFAGMPFVAGECVGNSSDLPHSEYHNGSEVNIFQNDVVMALGRRSDVVDFKYDPSKDAELYFIPAGTAIEMYGGTLHYAPFKVNPEGFKFVVMLPEGANEELPTEKTFDNPRIEKKSNWFFGYDNESMIGDTITIKGLG